MGPTTHSLRNINKTKQRRNVMSLQSTLDKGFEMKMDKKGCKLFKTTTGEVIVEGKRLPGGLYEWFSGKGNRTLIEAARSMIYAKNMSLKLWAEAVNTATYVLNRTGPTQIEGKTPYELWFDKKPAVDHLRIFGTECFVHVPDEKRRKLDAKSEKGILVGYCSNKDGYRIWMPNSNKVVTSRDVIFKETIPTFSLDIEKRNKELSSNQIDEQNDTQDIEKIESNVQTSDVYNLRDRSNISKPQRYIDAEINIAEGLEPKTYKEAMNEEMNSLTENDVYECTTLPPGQKPIDCKWVLKTKLNSKGEITRYKARLVAKGFAQKKGIDYEETFSPVARHDTIRTLLAIAANEDLKLVQFDIKTAFLYGDLQDQIYIKQPEGFNNGTDLVWKLKKSLYGLKQSPRCWNQKIVNFMKERCLKESTADPCLFFRKTNDHLLIIAIYVDDGIIAGTNEQEIKEFLDELMFSFKITSEPLNYFLGIEIERQPDGSIFINQKAYIKRILEKFNMSQANKVGTPTDNSTVPGEAEILENVPFREAIGSLMHLSCLTRPDITFALNKVSQKLAAPTKYDWEAVKRIFKYLVGTTEYGIMYQKGHKFPVTLRQDLLDSLIALRPDGREMLKACELLAASGLENMDFRCLDDCKSEDVGRVACALAGRGKVMRRLTVAGQWVFWPGGAALGWNLVDHASSLQELTLQNARKEELVRTLKACPSLRILKVLHHSLTDEDLDNLPMHTALRELGLPDSVTGRGLASALRHFPNVISLQASCLEDFLLETLTEESLYNATWWRDRLARLRAWYCQLPLGPESVPLLVDWCPNLTALGLETSEMTELEALRRLKYLRALHLSNSATLSASFLDDVVPALTLRIRHLSLASFDSVDLASIGKLCPKLETLSVLWFVALGSGKCPPFSRLRSLRLRPRSNRTVSPLALRLLLTHSKNLRQLELFACPSLDDRFVRELSRSNQLKELHTLALRHGHGLSDSGLRALTAQSSKLHSWTVF
ncbi:hypothetical protein LAZ67_20001014 [Cordylochernes scorpioides]|uniref:Reverse transcriptase Ty1/copia-type domain-containing protein n=1 Tax=Cordylochernes scorpioides TaxID=51811 RepID=A0ABY6LJI8_9ARAC|nr:hypothetical protein LAZ67_20001014 [Cordylochernes scorpioides]